MFFLRFIMNDNTLLEIIQMNDKYINLTKIKSQLEEYLNLESVGFIHSIKPWEYVGLTKPEYEIIIKIINQNLNEMIQGKQLYVKKKSTFH